MTHKPTNLDRVRAAEDALNTRISWIPRTDRRSPILEAHRAVIHADLIDRRSGITFEAEVTPGLVLANKVLAVTR